MSSLLLYNFVCKFIIHSSVSYGIFYLKICKVMYPSKNDRKIPNFIEKEIVVGKSDNCVGYQDAFALLNRYINGKVVVIEKAGHNLQIEQSLKFNALVEEWITQIQQRLK